MPDRERQPPPDLAPWELGSRLRVLRLCARATQADFACLIGVSVRTVIRWEGGKLPPATCRRLAPRLLREYAHAADQFARQAPAKPPDDKPPADQRPDAPPG